MVAPSLIGILASGVAATLVGFIWYGPLFGSIWKRQIGDNNMGSVSRMIRSTLIAFIASMLLAYVMTYFGIAWNVFDWIGALELGIWCWLGFIATTLLSGVLWEGRTFTWYLINAGYWFVMCIVIAFILVYSAMLGAVA